MKTKKNNKNNKNNNKTKIDLLTQYQHQDEKLNRIFLVCMQ